MGTAERPLHAAETVLDTGNEDVTACLLAWRRGDKDALARLLPRVYRELRGLAGACMAKERGDHTLQPTALVHEAYVRLVDRARVDVDHRGQFFAIAAQAMRRVLVDHARRRNFQKRGGGRRAISLEDVGEIGVTLDADLMALDDSLEALAQVDPEKAKIVELRYFGGFTLEETAAILGAGRSTVVRHWRMAKAWLYQHLAVDGDATTVPGSGS